MKPGDWVWMAIGAGWLAWLATTTFAVRRRLPTFAAIVRWPLQWWLGRILLLGAWAEVGWHLFTQRP